MTMERKDIVNGDSVNKIVAQTVAKYGMLEYVCYSANKRKKFIERLKGAKLDDDNMSQMIDLYLQIFEISEKTKSIFLGDVDIQEIFHCSSIILGAETIMFDIGKIFKDNLSSRKCNDVSHIIEEEGKRIKAFYGQNKETRGCKKSRRINE